MIELKDGTILRNLEEQVLENKEQIALHWNVDRVLADFGIHVRGRLDNKADLDQVATGDLEYGDAYLVGTAEPYNVWIWTRADANAGELNDYWLNIGHIAIEGPTGPQGPQGEAGEDGVSAIWYSGSSSPIPAAIYNAGDMFLLTNTANVSSSNGNVYRYNGSAWELQGNIRGPQGIQGLQGIPGPQGERGPQGIPGERGDVGGFINIWGILSDANQLPTPEDIKNLTAAYLVGTAVPYDLYVQIGENSEEAIWTNTGAFNAATLVTVGGEGQNVWNADTKLDKNTTTTNNDQVYIKWGGGMQGMIDLTYHAEPFVIPQRDQYGSFILPETVPEKNDRAISKAAADTLYMPKFPTFTNGRYRFNTYGPNDATATVEVANYGNPPTGYGMARGNVAGNITVADPTVGTDAANKQYVDSAIETAVTGAVKKKYTYTFNLFNTYSSSNEAHSWHYIVFNVESDIETIPTSIAAIVQMLVTEGYSGSSSVGGSRVFVSQSYPSGDDPTDAVVLIWGNPSNNNLYFSSRLDIGVRLVTPSTTSFKAYRTLN